MPIAEDLQAWQGHACAKQEYLEVLYTMFGLQMAGI